MLFEVGPVAENRRASQSAARSVIVKISVAVRRRFVATASRLVWARLYECVQLGNIRHNSEKM